MRTISKKKSQAGIRLHVALNGNDGWSGSLPNPVDSGLDGPLATIEEARNRLNKLRKEGKLRSHAVVFIHEGIHELTAPLTFTEEDLGTPQTSVTYKAYDGTSTVLTGAIRLQGFESWRNSILKMNVRNTKLDGMKIDQLLYNGVRQTKSRFPNKSPKHRYNEEWLYVDGESVSMLEDGHGNKSSFVCSDLIGKSWLSIEGAEVIIFPRYNYKNDCLPIAKFDEKTGRIDLEGTASYDIYPGDRFYIQHIFEELTEPGEWYFDDREGILYFYPPDDQWHYAVISVPVIDRIIQVEGTRKAEIVSSIEKIDWTDHEHSMNLMQKPEDFQTGYLRFQNLTIEGCTDCAVYVRNAREVSVLECTIRNSGTAGVIVLGGSACEVRDCDIYEVGNHGIYLSGGRRFPFIFAFDPCGHQAVNNYIHHIGNFQKAAAGVAINGVGIIVSNNYIHDSPRWGILSRGNLNKIEYNHIRHVCVETSDTSAIYLVDRDWTMRGTKIRYNRIHDVLGLQSVNGQLKSPAYAFGIYLDDFTSGVEVAANLIYRTPNAGVFIHAGKENLIENNMILETTGEAAFFDREYEINEANYMGTFKNSFRKNQFKHNILYSNQPEAYAYRISNANPEEGDELAEPSNSWLNNLCWFPKSHSFIKYGYRLSDVSWSNGMMDWEEWMNRGNDEGSISADPLFVDEENDNYQLRDESPAKKIGFQRLPIDKMGLLNSPFRQKNPLREAEGVREYPINLS